MILPNIEGASGLRAADRATLRSLVEVAASVASRNHVLVDYYESRVEPEEIGIDSVPESVRVPARCDWARKAVTSVSERVRLDGFTFPGEFEDPTMSALERGGAVSDAFNRHVSSELTHGCMFATVNRGPAGAPFVRMHTAETACAIWDEAEQRVGAGLAVADVARTAWSPSTPVPVQANLHLPDAVVVLRRTGPSEWEAETLPHPMGRPLMEALCYRPTGTKPFGESRITPAVRYLVDEVLRTLRNMAVSSALYAAPSKYALGLTEEQYDAMAQNKPSFAVTSMFLATKDDDGNTVQYGQLPANAPTPFVDALMTYGKIFSGVTGVPLNSLGIVQDNPSSAEAISAQREDICVAAEDCIETNRVGMRNVALMAMAIGSNVGLDGLSDEQRSVIPNFRDPMRPNLAATADAMTKIAGVLPDFAKTTTFLSAMGFSQAVIEKIRTELRDSENRAALSALARGGGQNGGG